MEIKKIPWMTQGAIAYLEESLRKDMTLFEWGSGSSTVWFASRVAHVYTVEHQGDWVAKVKEALFEKGLTNVTLLYRNYPIPKNGVHVKALPYMDNLLEKDKQLLRDYARAIVTIGTMFDVIVVDGRNRVECVKEAIVYLKHGGLLICDDFQRERYQPARDLLKGWSRQEFGSRGGQVTFVYRSL